jgi:hypothetical protein
VFGGDDLLTGTAMVGDGSGGVVQVSFSGILLCDGGAGLADFKSE